MFYEHIEVEIKSGNHFSMKKVFENIDEHEELATLELGEEVVVDMTNGTIFDCVVTHKNVMSGGWGLNMEYTLETK